MSNVFRLVRPSQSDSIAVLKTLLRRASDGDLAGLVLWCRSVSGADEVALTGIYAEHPEAALSATIRMTRRLTDDSE